MIFTEDKLKEARDAGYSDEEIWSHVSSADENFNTAKSEGYSLDEVATYFSSKKPEPREFFSFEDAVSAIGTIPEALAVGVPAAYQKLVTGLEIPEKSEAIESELAFQQRIQTEQEDRVASGKATSVGSAIREAVPSLGFSVLPMVAAIPAGIGGAMAGGPAAPVTGPAAAMAASGTVAYRMAGSDMMYRAYKQLEEAKGSSLTNEEKAEYYKTVLPIAQNYGIWEAGPEAVSNAITMGVGKFVFGFGKQAAKKLVGESIDSANKTIARKVAEKGAAVAGGLGAEIASEGVTAVGQYPEEAKIRQLAATGEVSKGEQPSYPGGYMQAVKDVAPATIALYGMMGTAAGGVKLSTLPFRSQKTPEQIAEDNINIEADRVSRELSIGETDEETKSINAALETARNNLIAKKEVYTALEPNDPAAQSLGLEIREMEREVVALDNELKKRVGEPVSEPITEAERQQAELAKAFVEEAAGAPTGKESLTVPPAQAARNKDLFPETTDFMGKLPTEAAISSYTEKDGIGTATYVNPQNGSTDVYISAFGDNDFIAYIRIYDEQGNPTNRFASKLERRTERGGATRSMLEELQAMLPEGHEYTEDVSASTDGLRFISSQLNRGYELVRNKAGGVETNRIAINGESRVNDLGADVIRAGQEFADIQVTNKKTFDRVKSVLAPVLEKFNAGLNENNIYWENGRVYVDIPVLRKAEKAAAAPVSETITEPTAITPAPVIEGLQAVSENTATPEQLTQLSQSGLVDIIKGQPVINEEGQAALTKAQAPLPALTPEERRAEIEAKPVEQVVTPPVELDTQTRNGIQSGVASADPDMRELWAIQLKAKLDKKGSLTWKDIPQELSDSMDTMEFGALKKALAINPQAAINLIEGNVTPPVKVTPAPVVSEEVAQVSEVTPAPTIAEAAPVEPITPAPVTEQAAPAVAPAPEVAPALERTTAGKQIIKQAEEGGVNLAELNTIESAIQQIDNPQSSIIPEATTAEAIQYLQYTPEGTSVIDHLRNLSQLKDKRDAGIKKRATAILEKLTAAAPVSETITEPVPTEVSGKIKRGAKRRRMADRPTPLPENERYGQVKLNRRVQKYFGGKIPARVYVVDDAVDPEYEYKAAYYPDLGILILNNAFIKKNENIGDIIAHELGHYAFGDKKFKAAFDKFYNSLSPEEKVDVDNLMGDAYKKDTEESQMEERKVIAFTSYTIATPQRRTLWNAVLDAMKAFANKFLGKNFEFSDPTRTALAMLATAKKRFAAGEEIVREEEEAKKIAAQGMNARFAELEARAKAGDKEAEAEAQRMVDEAAKASGLPILDDSASEAYRARRTPPPQKTIKGYKLFTTKPNRQGELFPLFVGANESVPQGVWLDAIEGRAAAPSKTGKPQVKSKLGPLAFRPGWHAGDLPLATHIGIKNAEGKVSARRANEVWAEVELANDTDYQPEADASKTRDLRSMPKDGAYRFKTNPNMTGNWIISGSMKVNRIMSQQEVDSILEQNNVTPMPWEGGVLDLQRMGLSTEKAVNTLKLSDPFTYDDAGNLIPLSERFQPTTPDIRRMAAGLRFTKEGELERYTDRGTIVKLAIRQEKDTPKGILSETIKIIKERVFDGDSTPSENTTRKAWSLIGSLVKTNKESVDNADAINELTRETMQEVSLPEGAEESDRANYEVIKQTVGAVKARNELYKYAIKLSGTGDKSMLDYLLNNSLNIVGRSATDEESVGRVLGALSGVKSWIIQSSEAEQASFIQMAAQRFFNTKNPTKDQIGKILLILTGVNETKIDESGAIIDGLTNVGQRIGVALGEKINDEIDKYAKPEIKDPMVAAITAMLKLGGTFVYKRVKNRIKVAVEKTIKGGIANYRNKLVEGAANGLETGFWKTLADTENKPGPLGELDAAQNRELGNIVKSMLVSLGLKGTPPNTKMDIYEQVASILGEKPLSKDKTELADNKIRSEIESKRQRELEETDDSDAKDAINVKYDGIENAWDEAMSRQLDMPVSDAMFRRLIFNELKENKTSVTKLAKLMNEEPVIGASRQDRLVDAIINKIAGVTFEGQNPADYSALKEYLSNQLESLIQEKQTKGMVLKTKERIEANQAKREIDKLAKIQSDTPNFPTATEIANPVRDAVKNALKLVLNPMFDPKAAADIMRNWKKEFATELQQIGVDEATALTLTDIVGRQIELDSMSKNLDSINDAIENGSLNGIVNAIKNTPLADQQSPDWRYNVMRDYLRNSGLPLKQAERLAKIMDIELQSRFSKAQETAATDIAKRLVKGFNPQSNRGFQLLIQAIRAQALNPGSNVATEFGKIMGWTGFTPQQIKQLNDLDSIVNNESSTESEKAVAIEKIKQIIDKISAPIMVRDTLAAFYVAQALGRLTVATVQIVDPILYSAFDNLMASARNIKSPAQVFQIWSTFASSFINAGREFAFSFKNNVSRSGRLVDYLETQDRKLRRLTNDAQKEWSTGRSNPKTILKFMIGLTDITSRTLKALDDAGYSLLEKNALNLYMISAMNLAKIPKSQQLATLRMIAQARQTDIADMMAKGISKNDAIIYANERMKSEVMSALSGLKINSQEVVDSATNEALSRIGKLRYNGNVEIKDKGFLSAPFLAMYEGISKVANEKEGFEGEALRIFQRMLIGFPVIVARVANIAYGYTPLTVYRHLLQKTSNRYPLTYGTSLQRRKRWMEQLTGTVIGLALYAFAKPSYDEDDDDFKIVITGFGPIKSKDPEFYNQWNKKHNPGSFEVFFNGTKFSIDSKSSGPLKPFIEIMGAIDDWSLGKHQAGEKMTKAERATAEQNAGILGTIGEISGSLLLMSARRGPATGFMQGLIDWRRYPNDPIAALAQEASFSLLPLVPVVGFGAVKNFSDFLSEPIDTRTKEGAILNNIPIIGPMFGKPAINAYGQPLGDVQFSEKIKKSIGIPITLVPVSSEADQKLAKITIKNASGPRPLERSWLDSKLINPLTDREWRLANEEYAKNNRKIVLDNYDILNSYEPNEYSESMSILGTESRDIALSKIVLLRETP